MKIIKSTLPVLCLLILCCYFFSCGNNKPAEENSETGNSDTTDSPVVKYLEKDRSIIVNSDTLLRHFNDLVLIFECLKKCDDCSKTPCDPKCDEICKELSDRSFVVPEDALKEVPGNRLRNLLVVSKEAQDLKLQFSYKKILSKKNSVKFNIMSAELDNMIANLDIMYKTALLLRESKKLK